MISFTEQADDCSDQRHRQENEVSKSIDYELALEYECVADESPAVAGCLSFSRAWIHSFQSAVRRSMHQVNQGINRCRTSNMRKYRIARPHWQLQPLMFRNCTGRSPKSYIVD